MSTTSANVRIAAVLQCTVATSVVLTGVPVLYANFSHLHAAMCQTVHSFNESLTTFANNKSFNKLKNAIKYIILSSTQLKKDSHAEHLSKSPINTTLVEKVSGNGGSNSCTKVQLQYFTSDNGRCSCL